MSKLDYDRLELEVAAIIKNHPLNPVPNPTGTVGQTWQVDAKHMAKHIAAIVKKFVEEAGE